MSLYKYLILCYLSFGIGANAQVPDLVLYNGRIWSGEADARDGEAIAIRGNKIMMTGPSAVVRKLATSRTRQIDLGGKLVIPGFNDAHIHFLDGAVGLTEVDLTEANSPAEVVKKVTDYAKKNTGKKWIIGRGWQYTIFPDGLPSAKLLEGIPEDRPVMLQAYDGHSGWVNQEALRLSGLKTNPRYEGFGKVVLDEHGVPTGALLEEAQSIVSKLIPPLTENENLEALRAGLKVAASLGITSLQNASGSHQELLLYLDLLRKNELTARYSAALSVDAATPQKEIDEFVTIRDRLATGNPRVRINTIKFMMDGVIESHTAAMLAPYNDVTDGNMGEFAMPSVRYRELVGQLDKLGFQLYTHAIGDRAVREALDAYEQAAITNGPKPRRHRIEHIETISPVDIPRFAQLGVLASMEPIHADPGTMEVWSSAIGKERMPWSFAWASLQKAGAYLVFSSDWPACISLDPIRGIHVAVNRRTPEGNPPGGWLPEQAISLQQALLAYTKAGAYASFEEGIKGELKSGQLADIVVLSQDLFKIDPMKIYETKVVMTIFDGKIIYESPPR